MSFRGYLICLLSIALLAPALAHAGQTAVDRAGFSVHLQDETVVTEVLSVTNLDAGTQRYTLAVAGDRALSDYVSFSPKSFSVAPGETQTIAVRFRKPKEPLAGALELVSFDATRRAELKVGSGITLPVVLEAGAVLGASIENGVFHASRGAMVAAVYAADILLAGAAMLFLRRKFLRRGGRKVRISFV